jgi:hypothetical protein
VDENRHRLTLPAPLERLRPAWWTLRRGAILLRHRARRALPVDAEKIAAVQKVFILSTGRTGTMFLAHFFDGHSAQVRAYHEPYPPLLALGLQAARGQITAVSAAAQLAHERRRLLHCLDRPVYLEANNRLFALAPALALAYPGVKIVHVVRDGRAVVSSALARGWYGPADRFPRLAAADFAADPWRDAWAGWSMLQKNAWLWQKQNRIIRESAAALPEYRLVRFEDLFAGENNEWTAVRDLLRFIDPHLALADETLAAAFALRANAGPPHAPWTPAEREAFTQIAGAEMAFYDYM